MPKNKIEDLRNHLFETIELLKDKKIKIETAQAICEVSSQIVEIAKVEVSLVKALEKNAPVTNFFIDKER